MTKSGINIRLPRLDCIQHFHHGGGCLRPWHWLLPTRGSGLVPGSPVLSCPRPPCGNLIASSLPPPIPSFLVYSVSKSPVQYFVYIHWPFPLRLAVYLAHRTVVQVVACAVHLLVSLRCAHLDPIHRNFPPQRPFSATLRQLHNIPKACSCMGPPHTYTHNSLGSACPTQLARDAP